MRWLAVLVLAGVGWSPRPSPEPPVCLHPPVVAPVVDPFRPPPCRWCSGNRGLEYRVAPGTPVRAAGGGTVGYAGSVASVRYVVVDHPSGLRTTYGHLETVRVRVGDRVARGEVLGSVAGSFHFGVRRGQQYLDPADYLVRRDAGPRLIPISGPARRPARLRLTCTAAGARR